MHYTPHTEDGGVHCIPDTKQGSIHYTIHTERVVYTTHPIQMRVVYTIPQRYEHYIPHSKEVYTTHLTKKEWCTLHIQ